MTSGPHPAIPCGAHRHGMEPCEAYAVVGSDPPRCRMHLGRKVSEVKESAAALIWEQRAHQAALDMLQDRDSPHFDPSRIKPGIDLVAEHERTLAIDVAMRDYLMERVAAVEHLETVNGEGSEDVRGLFRAWERAQDRCERSQLNAGKLGLEERRLRLDQAKAAMVMTAFAEAHDGMPPAELDRLRERFLDAMARLEGQPSDGSPMTRGRELR